MLRLQPIWWRKISPASEFGSVAGEPSFVGRGMFGRWGQVVVAVDVAAVVVGVGIVGTDGKAVVVEVAAGSAGSVGDGVTGA